MLSKNLSIWYFEEMRFSIFALLFIHCLSALELTIQDVTIEVEVAATDETKTKGLSGRKTLEEGTGMLFVYGKAQIGRFWMKDTFVPLSIGFFDEQRRLIEWQDMPPPGDTTPIVKSTVPCLYALEVPKGWFQRHRIQPGAQFSYGLK